MQDDELLNILKTDPNTGMTLLLKQYAGLIYSVVKHKLAGSIRAWLCVIGRNHPITRSIKIYSIKRVS